MEKQCELSWNLKQVIPEVVIDETVELTVGASKEFNTNGKSFDSYEFVAFDLTFSGYAPDLPVANFDKIDDYSSINALYDYTNYRNDWILDGTVSGKTATVYFKRTINNPPIGLVKETDGEVNKSESIRFRAFWHGEYMDSSSTNIYDFYTVLTWRTQFGTNLITVSVPTASNEKNSIITTHVKITGYKAKDASSSSSPI